MYLKRLRELREDNDKKQINIADYLQMKQPQYARYELGKRDISAEDLKKLALYYNTSVDYILELTDEIKPYKRKNSLNFQIKKH